jgi:hypothetical protein
MTKEECRVYNIEKVGQTDHAMDINGVNVKQNDFTCRHENRQNAGNFAPIAT